MMGDEFMAEMDRRTREFQLKRAYFHEAARPYMQQMTWIRMIYTKPVMIVGKEGTELQQIWDPEGKAAYEKYQQALDQMRESIFGKNPEGTHS